MPDKLSYPEIKDVVFRKAKILPSLQESLPQPAASLATSLFLMAFKCSNHKQNLGDDSQESTAANQQYRRENVGMLLKQCSEQASDADKAYCLGIITGAAQLMVGDPHDRYGYKSADSPICIADEDSYEQIKARIIRVGPASATCCF